MIRLEGVTKLFPGQARPAVDAIDLDVPDGATCALIGASGCGKTTTLRMINRLIEPTSGRIMVGGEDVTRADPVRLRRRVGYVIQGVGLFPHRSIADNVATVPRLLGWDERRVAARTDEMLALVGLDPATFRGRRPASLSGGQRQRVGVARALAADPPVMLMDEPFGAVDPVVRGRLQREFKEILARLGKTVVMVTHDINEAIRMGDRIAVMREGRIVQHDTPDRLLAEPKDPLVMDFVGADRALKRLSLITAGEAASAATPAQISGDQVSGAQVPGAQVPGADMPAVEASASVQDALSILLTAGTDRVAVRGPDGASRELTLDAIRALAAPDRPIPTGTGQA